MEPSQRRRPARMLIRSGASWSWLSRTTGSTTGSTTATTTFLAGCRPTTPASKKPYYRNAPAKRRHPRVAAATVSPARRSGASTGEQKTSAQAAFDSHGDSVARVSTAPTSRPGAMTSPESQPGSCQARSRSSPARSTERRPASCSTSTVHNFACLGGQSQARRPAVHHAEERPDRKGVLPERHRRGSRQPMQPPTS